MMLYGLNIGDSMDAYGHTNARIPSHLWSKQFVVGWIVSDLFSVGVDRRLLVGHLVGDGRGAVDRFNIKFNRTGD